MDGQFVLLLIGAYLIGSLPFGVWVSKAYGVNILERGSGNPGATNVLRECGKTAGLIVFVLDVVKGLVPALAGQYLSNHEMAPLLLGLAAIVGHSLSPFLKFKGGKGISTGLGALLGSTPIVAICALGTFIVTLFIWRYVSLSSMFAGLAVFTFGWILGDPIPAVIAYALLAIFVIVRHKPNIQRLKEGNERKFSLKKKPEDPPKDPPE